MRIDGKVAIVTGGASGLGRATAEMLADGGATVVICDLPGSPGAEVAAARPESLRFVAADVRDAEQVQQVVDAAVELGGPRIVVNCAGVGTPGRVIGRDGVLPLEEFERVVGINLVGTFNVLRLAAVAMSELPEDGEERGVIVNTASVAAFDGQIGQAAYSASKGGVAAMTLPVARDLSSRKIRVMAIAPGIFATPMVSGLPQPAQDSLAAQIPHPARLGQPSEYAALVRHICENAMLNGEVIRLDGAIRMAPR